MWPKPTFSPFPFHVSCALLGLFCALKLQCYKQSAKGGEAAKGGSNVL